MTDQKVIDKIKKCLALAGNNSSSAEAETAALMAQQLMAKHGVEVVDLEGEETPEEKIEIAKEPVGPGSAWKTQLAAIVAENFRCKTFSYGKQVIAFYGYSTDTQAAREVFRFLFKMGHKMALKARVDKTKMGYSGEGVYNSFVLGYMAGLKEKLGEQSKALMIVIAKEVKEEYSEFIKDAKTSNAKNLAAGGFDRGAYNKGFQEGKHAMGARELNA